MTDVHLDAAALRDLAEETQSSRRFCAVLWGFVFAFGGVATAFSDPMGVTLSILAAFVATLLTLGMGKPTINERLDRPHLYRAVTGTFLAVALFGVVLGVLPHANDTTKTLAMYFGLVALLAYRALVATGPRAALVAVTLAMITLAPVALVSFVTFGCRYDAPRPTWTAAASVYTLEAVLLLLPALAIAALLAFRPRHDFMPDALLLRKRRAE